MIEVANLAKAGENTGQIEFIQKHDLLRAQFDRLMISLYPKGKITTEQRKKILEKIFSSAETEHPELKEHLEKLKGPGGLNVDLL